MRQLLGDKAYCVWYIKEKITKHLGEYVLITEICGEDIVVTLQTTASFILHDFYCQGKSEDIEAETL